MANSIVLLIGNPFYNFFSKYFIILTIILLLLERRRNAPCLTIIVTIIGRLQLQKYNAPLYI